MAGISRDHVFISYCRKDKRWLDELLKHLKPRLRDGSIAAWSDKQIEPGSKWMNDIQAALQRAKVAVLLVTPDFFASDFIHVHELGPLLQNAENGEVTILWVPIHASTYEKSAIAEIQPVIDAAKPLAGMKTEKRNQAWVAICDSIEEALGSPLPTKPLEFVRLLDNLCKSIEHGELKASPLARNVYDELSKETALRPVENYELGWIVDGVIHSEEYRVKTIAQAGVQDWQQDFPQYAGPTLGGLGRSLERSPYMQEFIVRLCNILAERLLLELTWPAEPEIYNELVNSIYSACCDATDVLSDDVVAALKGLTVIGPKKSNR